MIIGAAAERPMIFTLVFTNGQIVDAGDAAAHVAVFIKFPVLVSVRTKPVSGIVMPFVGESHSDAIPLKRPKFFDEAIVKFLVPLARKELDDGVASGKKFGTVAPDGIHGVGERDALRVASVPGVLSHPNFLDSGLGIERREGWPRSFHIRDQ